jgi:hypothetical protein
MASTIPTTTKIQAMLAAAPAIPLNPKIAAIMAMTKNVIAHPIILPSIDSYLGQYARIGTLQPKGNHIDAVLDRLNNGIST